MTDKDWQQLKSELNQHLSNASNLQGRRAMLLEQLESKFGVATLAEARKELVVLERELVEAKNVLDECLEKLAEHEGNDAE